jgi:hypothetical protein
MIAINKTALISKIIYTIFLTLVGLLAGCQLLAQVKFYTQVSEPTVAQRQAFQVQYTIEGANSIRNFELPRFTNFQVVEVFDNSTSVFNGKTLSESYSKIVVLVATAKGRFSIPGAVATINGKPMRSNAKTVEVLKSSAPGIQHINPDDIDTEEESMLRPGDNIDEKVKQNFFLRVEPSKTTCYVGEPLMVTYKAYSRLNANSQVVKRPSLTGFSVMEMVDAYDGKPAIEKLNGRLYYTNLIRKVQLFPLQEGTFKLDPAEIESVIHFVKTNEEAGGIRKMFGNGAMATPIKHRTVLRTDSLTITVKPLPTATQPEDFSGAVGRFDLVVKVPDAPVHKGDLVKIQVVITGSGNLSLLTPPHINWPAGVDTAEPAVKENINKYAFPLSGSKTFEYSFAAPDTGDYVIPAIRLPYFDPAANEYKNAKTDSITLHVLPALHRADVKRDNLVSGNSSIPKQFYWFALVAAIIVGSIVFQVVLLGRNKRSTTNKVKGADEAASPLSVLSPARQALEQNNQHDFYNEIQQALWKVVADKYQVLPSQWNKHHIEDLLAKKQVPADAIKNFEAVLDECEWALYTPNHSISSMEATLTRAEDVVKQFI